MYCWGADTNGQQGDGSPSFTVPTERATLVAGLPSIGTIGLGGFHTCAIFSVSGAVNCWGGNSTGQLGNGTTTDLAVWNSESQDFDRDGCADWREVQTTSGLQTTGGLRNPKNFWDFFDTPDTTNTTLSAAITSGATPPFNITVASVSAFPASNDTFYVDNEKFSWDTKTSPSTFHITARARDGTTAAAHSVNAVVMRNVRDRKVDSTDVNRIQARYYTSGSTSIDPLSPPPPTGYHTAFDRTGGSPNNWNLSGPDGLIRIQDIVYASNQSGHNCQPPP
jgi:hypothetical protein